MTQDFERFRTCADAYGADARRWPAADRALHAAFARTPEGEAILAAAARTDGFLDAWTSGPPAGTLAERIADTALDARPQRRRRRIAWSAAAFAASAVFGFAVGFMQVSAGPDADLLSQLIVGPAVAPRVGL